MPTVLVLQDTGKDILDLLNLDQPVDDAQKKTIFIPEGPLAQQKLLDFELGSLGSTFSEFSSSTLGQVR